MRIDMVGGGAIGLLFAARLATAGAAVTVWTRTESQAAALTAGGIDYRDGEEGAPTVHVGVASQCLADLTEPLASGQSEEEHWVVLAVKQSHLNEELLSRLRRLVKPGTRILGLQNGVGHLEKLAEALPGASLYAGVTTEGAKRSGETGVIHTGHGQLFWGPLRVNGSESDKKGEKSQNLWIKTLESAGFSATLSNDMNSRIYEKLLINAVINPLTALYDVTNGELPMHPLRKKLMHALYSETMEVLASDGLAMDSDGWQRVLGVCQATAGNVSSMLADVRAGRVTEIEWINGGVSRIAARIGLRSPLNDAICTLVSQLQVNENS
ncbi:ketopantoate reductase family protein [Paenibacillus radicis (ex Gao et al. 2016)]|uniref:2-dehydropantoate 2-reductase n=1 Tax=Paenibacillus radicis (ex Gao et al. 2016) TaxID=1737354 RepID=A0A917HTR0_9BACL|nr:2-dehydropantoate 2-reductase [Paenibacillus radicis (ex Gao et al. 2016)]GGG89009.1 putative 2-dehydropantoate 2-reductase [Paenibacillus radicis (ex Gao et al. 2016)]